jgi:hypothetical protein
MFKKYLITLKYILEELPELNSELEEKSRYIRSLEKLKEKPEEKHQIEKPTDLSKTKRKEQKKIKLSK